MLAVHFSRVLPRSQAAKYRFFSILNLVIHFSRQKASILCLDGSRDCTILAKKDPLQWLIVLWRAFEVSRSFDVCQSHFSNFPASFLDLFSVLVVDQIMIPECLGLLDKRPPKWSNLEVTSVQVWQPTNCCRGSSFGSPDRVSSFVRHGAYLLAQLPTFSP